MLNRHGQNIRIMNALTFCAHSPKSERNAPLPSNLTRDMREAGEAKGKLFLTGFPLSTNLTHSPPPFCTSAEYVP